MMMSLDFVGIPEFWCTAFKNCELFSEFIRVSRGGLARMLEGAQIRFFVVCFVLFSKA